MNYKSSMTDVGNEMIAQAHKDDKAIIFDSFLVSEALSDTGVELTKTTKNLFSNPLTYPINSKATSDNTFTVKAVLANKTDKFTVDEDFSINVIGVLAHIDGSSDSRLITIAVAEGTGAVITAFRDTLYSLTVAITQAYKADQPANFGLANVAYALADDLDKLKTDIQIIIDGGLTDVAKINEANTFTEAQKFDKGATDGKGNAYATMKDVATGLNNGLSTKVTDNKDGTEQLNGVQVQPFNKLSDTIGGRNYLLNSDQPITVSEANNRYTIIPTKLKTLSAGTYIFTANVSGLVGNQTSLTIGLSNPSNHNDYNASNVPIINGTVTKKMTITDGDIHTNVIIYSGTNGWPGSAGCTAIYTNYQLIKSDVVKDWTPAPEDKVNVSDMRTPASDVAGIEEVNAKQDKIGYTPADDSKVVHDNGDGTVTVDGQTYTPANDVYAIKRNDAGNTVGTVKIPDGNLQSSAGDRFYPIKWFNSYDEAMTYSKSHPYVDCRW
ncbi:hypothetical protein [Levilactobacillus namurensis]|uniref:hypothetical protein n=1 Tax=Levilactobacillus namurensis TaxID=380393 RepID=UPI0026F15BF1|nr:hypothetical protein [Levilactobacillus namurensis]